MKRDFRNTTKYTILARVAERNTASNFTNMSDWYSYSKWIDELGIESNITNVNSFHGKVVEKNINAKNCAEKIFDGVSDASDTYNTRFSAVLTNLSQYRTTVQALSDTINPEKGLFNPSYINTSLVESVNSYIEQDVVLTELAEGETDLDSISDDNILDTIVDTVVNHLPKVKTNQETSITIGPYIITYKVTTEVGEGDTTLNFDSVIDDQKAKLHNKFSINAKSVTNGRVTGYIDSEKARIGVEKDGMVISMDTDEKSSASMKWNIGNTSVTAGLNEGGVDQIIEWTDEDGDIITIKLHSGLESDYVETSIKRDLQNSNVTSFLKIERKQSKGEEQMEPVAVEESEPVTEQKSRSWFENLIYNYNRIPNCDFEDAGDDAWSDIPVNNDYDPSVDDDNAATVYDFTPESVLGDEWAESPEKTALALGCLGASMLAMTAPEWVPPILIFISSWGNEIKELITNVFNDLSTAFG